MQQTPQAGPVEEQFGRSVHAIRTLRQYSQRDFADRLTAKGMAVDASAVSRIEKGARSVRLAEALAIADVLDTELDFLLEGSRSPAQELRTLRRNADTSMRALEPPLIEFMGRFNEVRQFLRDNPELLNELGNEGADDGPKAASEYLNWVGMRMAAIGEDNNSWFAVGTTEEADALATLAYQFARSLISVGIDEVEGRDDGEHSEEA